MPNETTEARDFYSLLGVGGQDAEEVRRLARAWLGTNAAHDPARSASLKPLRHAPRRRRS
jgi:hypothetical protein